MNGFPDDHAPDCGCCSQEASARAHFVAACFLVVGIVAVTAAIGFHLAS